LLQKTERETSIDFDNMKPEEAWLRELKKGIRQRYLSRLQDFCTWANLSIEKIMDDYKKANDKRLWRKKMGSLVVAYYQHKLSLGYKVNAARSDTIPIRSFLTSQCETVFIKRGSISKPEIACGEHQLSLEELRRLYHLSDVKGKAFITTALLGWSPVDFLSLKTEYAKSLVEKAISEKKDFVQFLYSRQKTSETVIAHLGKEAIESLDDYLKTVPSDAEYLWYSPDEHTKPLSNHSLNDYLKLLFKQASLKTVGQLKFSAFRKYTFSTLQRYGMTDSESRICVGKSVSSDVRTYLINLKDTLLEKYKKAYYEGFCLAPRSNGRIASLEEDGKLFMEALWRLVKPEMEKLRLQRAINPHKAIGLTTVEELPKDPREGLGLYLKWKEEEQ
jgi:hypothetical protein